MSEIGIVLLGSLAVALIGAAIFGLLMLGRPEVEPMIFNIYPKRVEITYNEKPPIQFVDVRGSMTSVTTFFLFEGLTVFVLGFGPTYEVYKIAGTPRVVRKFIRKHAKDNPKEVLKRMGL